STVWIMDALRGQTDGFHRAVDRFEKLHWGGVGLRQVARLSNSSNFEWLEDYSIHALSKLIKQKEVFDFIFIDGNHRFDDILVDYYLADQLLAPKGIVALDDMWMPSVRTVVSFIKSNRQYDVVAQPVRGMAILQKRADDNRDWRHFEQFKVHKNSRRREALVE